MSAQANAALLKKGSDALNKWITITAPADEEDAEGPVEREVYEVNPPLLSAPGLGAPPTQRVLQIGLGAEHGVLLTDAGTCFTWGDNRYGQLGRRPCKKEENNEPFPVLNLLSHELLQVASGKHHCLALTAKGLVYAWGRNKSGQLGCGDVRDRVLPVHVRLEQKIDHRVEEAQALLGAKSPVISISAGMNSSVAVDEASNVFQWGGISSEFREENKNAVGASEKRAFHIMKCYPHQVMRDSDFRTQLRTARVSITEAACSSRATAKVDDKFDIDYRERVKKLVIDIISHKEDVGKRRDELLNFEEKLTEDRRKKVGEVEVSETNNLQETTATIEREILSIRKEIEVCKKNLHSCEAQQKHQKKQLGELQDLTTKLSASEDEAAVQLSASRKGTSEARSLEKRIQDIKEFMEANQNTRMALLDQRAETDKDKQHLQTQLQTKQKEVDDKLRRLKLLKDLAKPSDTEGISNSIIAMLQRHKDDLTKFFDTSALTTNFEKSVSPAAAYVQRKRLEEADCVDLDRVERSIAEMPMQFEGKESSDNVRRCVEILQELVELRRSWTRSILDKDFPQDQNMSMFFTGAKKPTLPGRPNADLQGDPSSKLATV